MSTENPLATADSVLPPFARAYGEALGSAELKSQCEDFQVDETLSFELDGEGEHVFLRLEKRDLNTHDVVRELQAIAKVKPVSIGYCGLKDKRAVTRQWFSVHCGLNNDPDWSALQASGILVLEQTRHSKKLRIGTHKHNHFDIRLRGMSVDGDVLAKRMEQIELGGFPNYFGEQRFGGNGSNLAAASAMFNRLRPSESGQRTKRFKPRRKDQMLLSAARSLLFNSILSERVAMGNWNQALLGDVYQFDDGSSLFKSPVDQLLEERLSANEVHATGALFGAGGVLPTDSVEAIEQKVFQAHPLYVDGLLQLGMSGARRALRAVPKEFQWQYADSVLHLQFNLKRGSYATSLIREIVQATVP